jgi:hypothetical protein
MTLRILVTLAFVLSGPACKSRPKAAPAPSPAPARASEATAAPSTILIRGKGTTARLERRGDAWLLSADDVDSISCRPHDANKRRCRTAAGAEVAEVKTHFDEGHPGEGSMKLLAPDGKLLWKAHLGAEKIKIGNNEENQDAWVLSLKHADKIKVADPNERTVGVVHHEGDEARVQGPDGEDLFTVEGAGASVAAALLLVSALPSRDRLILMAEFIARGL